MHTHEANSITWRTSSYSGNGGNCVEAGWRGTTVLVRDTKDRAGGTLLLNEPAWSAFLRSKRPDE